MFIVYPGILFGILMGAIVGSISILLDLLKWQSIAISVLLSSLLHQGIAKAMLWRYDLRPNRGLAELINSYGENRLIIWIIFSVQQSCSESSLTPSGFDSPNYSASNW